MKMEKPNYFGILPANVRYDKNLKPMEKILYTEISSLTNKDGYCYATNSYFSRLYEVHKNTVGTWINNLEKQGYIKTVLIYKKGTKEIIERRIYINQKIDIPINEKVDTYQQKDLEPINEKVDTPINENIEENNTSINNKINNIYLYKGSEFEKAFSDFKIMRVDKKEPLSKPAEDLILMKLYKLAGDNEQLAIEILNKSTINSWKDIFPIDKKQGGNKNGNTGNKRSYTRNTEKKGFDKHNDYKPDYSKGFDDWN
jgi:hypothetical protein